MSRFFLLAGCYLLLLNVAAGQLSVSKLFSNHAVLQRDADVPIWGTATANNFVIVELYQNDQSLYRSEVRSDSDGKWRAVIPKKAAGGPFGIIITSDQSKIILTDIYFGDVWLCSGQSNMEWQVAQSNDAEAEMAAANDPLIRHFKVPRTWNLLPSDTLAGGTWESTNPQTVGNFSAVAYYFAKNIRQHHDIPIGLLNSSWGGSRIEPWMHAKALGHVSAAESAKAIETRMENIKVERMKTMQSYLGNDLPTEDRGMKGDRPLWASESYNAQGWKKVKLPGFWEENGYPELDGIVWYRKEIYLTKGDITQNLELSLGTIDDADITYWNGQLIGNTSQYNEPRNYSVPKELLKVGANILTVRVTDNGWGGGFSGACEDLYYVSKKDKKSLCSVWSVAIGKVDFNRVVPISQIETVLYNQMIHPILNFPIKGALWYQGESNASVEGAADYQEEFPAMIRDWRKRWGQGNFPFLWVQLANWQPVEDQPSDTGWARLREAQSRTLQVPNTNQAVIIDIGETDDIHPRNKQDVGYRLSLGARNLAYGENVIDAGPQYRSMEIEGNKIRLHFNLQGSQLSARNGSLQEFAIAGKNRKFYWATAKIEGNTIVVTSDQVSNPVAVRYAWANNPIKANLYNTEGLPASPFRTDDWEWKEDQK